MSQSQIPASDLARLKGGQTIEVALASGKTLPVRLSRAPLAEADDAVLIDSLERLDILRGLDAHPHVAALAAPDCLAHAHRRQAEVRDWLRAGFQLFGAYKIGLKLARQARASGLVPRGFLDNDPAKHGTSIDGLAVSLPQHAALEGATVVVASGRHGNAIHAQLAAIPGIRLVNMSEFLYALDAPHAADAFAEFVAAPARDRFRFISAFLRMDDARSRQVFDALIGMRTGLSIALADGVKSAPEDEYFDSDFVDPVRAARFVDAGAATGDTLMRLEAKFGRVDQAWLFEPELPAYYEALRAYAEREEVWLFNMGLDERASRASYRPELSYDVASETESPIPAEITSYIQGVPLDAVVAGPVGLFKLDIEGMEARALRGSAAIIARDRPVIAVCAYHRADDYWRLIDEVLAIRPDYRIGMRLYSDILEDITLYFH